MHTNSRCGQPKIEQHFASLKATPPRTQGQPGSAAAVRQSSMEPCVLVKVPGLPYLVTIQPHNQAAQQAFSTRVKGQFLVRRQMW